MSNFIRPIIRMSAFLRKEIVEIFRQPRLVLSLVLGPFLILLLFGIGFHNQPRPLRALFVVEPGSVLAHYVQEYATTLGPQLLFMGITSQEAEARNRLRRGEVDLVVVAPREAYETIRDNRQAEFMMYHDELDPFQQDYIRIFGQIYIDEVNRRIIHNITEQGQVEAEVMQNMLQSGQASAAAMRQALEQGDAVTARFQQADLNRHISLLALTVGATATLLTGVQEALGEEDAGETEAVMASLVEIQEAMGLLDQVQPGRTDYSVEITQIRQIEEEIAQLEERLAEFQQIDPAIMVSPFRSEVQNIEPVMIDVADYFAPSVIILLLQHMAITIAGLSIVRERQIGTVELFRVWPLTAGETLTGKYLSYLFFGVILGFVLVALLVFVLGVPMLGDWLSLGLVLIVLLFSSLGLGFVISLTARTDSQAVQYAMLVLLMTVFFSGFFLNLQMFWPSVRVVSWLLPATYGIEMLQNIMLRGQPANLFSLASLAGIGIVLGVVAWLLMRRLMAHE